jgi:hypothetical protein
VISINSYRDFANMVASAKKDAEANVEAARKEGDGYEINWHRPVVLQTT